MACATKLSDADRFKGIRCQPPNFRCYSPRRIASSQAGKRLLGMPDAMQQSQGQLPLDLAIRAGWLEKGLCETRDRGCGDRFRINGNLTPVGGP
jgi:hypothetical protein